MDHPLLALGFLGILAGLAAALFFPKRGYYWRIQAIYRLSDRIKTEDAVKHLYHMAYSGRVASLQNLAGALEISGNRIEGRGLARHKDALR